MSLGNEVIQFNYKAEKAKKQSKPEKKTRRERGKAMHRSPEEKRRKNGGKEKGVFPADHGGRIRIRRFLPSDPSRR
jgi:hypothetical protein